MEQKQVQTIFDEVDLSTSLDGYVKNIRKRQSYSFWQEMQCLLDSGKDKEEILIQIWKGMDKRSSFGSEMNSRYSAESLKLFLVDNKESSCTELGKEEYLLVIAVDNSRPNCEVAGTIKGQEEAKKIFQKVKELKSWLESIANWTEELKEEAESKIEAIEERGIVIFDPEDDWIEGSPVDFDIMGLFKSQQVKVMKNE